MLPGAFNNEETHAQDDYSLPEPNAHAPYPSNAFSNNLLPDPSMDTQSDQFWDAIIDDVLSSTKAPPLPGDYYPSAVAGVDPRLFAPLDGSTSSHFQQSATPSTSSAPMTPDPNPDFAPLVRDYPNNPLPFALPYQEVPKESFPPITEPDVVVFMTDDARWEAVLNHNAQANGHFLYCVKTTQVYCRPTCPSRRPARSNVRFVFSIEEAQELGYRSCKRCKPEESMDPTQKRQQDVIERLKKELLRRRETGGGDGGKVTVTKIAQDMGVSMWHLNRLFKRHVGTSPKAWAQQQLAQHTGTS